MGSGVAILKCSYSQLMVSGRGGMVVGKDYFTLRAWPLGVFTMHQ